MSAGSQQRIELTSADRVLFPEDGVTKRDLFDYYGAVAPVLVPHLRDRPFTMKRWREGLAGGSFFQKQAPKGMPSWIPTRQFRTHPREGGSRLVDFPLVNSPDVLLWTVQMHCIDMNAWYSRIDRPDRPDFVLFDLDPPESPDGFALAVRVAHLIHGALERLDLRSYVKTSGADGIHVLVPITRRSEYGETYEFAERLARQLEAEHPGEVTTEWLKKKRVRRARRPPPERLGEDDRLGLLRPAQARRTDLDAAPLGRAARVDPTPRLLDGGRARADRAARRPVRAGAPRRPGARPGPAEPARGRVVGLTALSPSIFTGRSRCRPILARDGTRRCLHLAPAARPAAAHAGAASGPAVEIVIPVYNESPRCRRAYGGSSRAGTAA